MLTKMSPIPGLHANLFRVTRALQQGFQLTSEGETLILKGKTEICFDKKMENKSGEVFLLNTKFYKSADNAALLVFKKRNTEGKETIQPEGAAVKRQENTTTKHIVLWKVHANELHAKLSHHVEDRMGTTAKHLQ